MGKRVMTEQDEGRLKKKVAERRKTVENAEGDAAFRALRKRLKRSQRKRRTLASRRRHAAGKSTGATQKSEASPAS